MSSQESKTTRLSSIEKDIEQLKNNREEKHKTIESSLQEYKDERKNFYNQISEQLSGLKRTI
jgi:hypothetical protein